jgi:hypothetical protein
LAAEVELHETVAPADAELGGAVPGRWAASLFDERDRGFWHRERMFEIATDGTHAIIGGRAVSSMAERGTSTQKER